MTPFLDAYCERTGPGLWGEPLNAVTNLAFIVAAVMALRLWRAQPGLTYRNGWDLLLMIALLFAIGIGSALWHTFATRWAMSADTIPILLFINVFLLGFLVRLAGLRWVGTIAFFALFQLVNRGVKAQFPPDFLNGSIFYGPTWFTLLIMTSLLAGATASSSAQLRPRDRRVHRVPLLPHDRRAHLRNAPDRYPFPLARSQCDRALSAARGADSRGGETAPHTLSAVMAGRPTRPPRPPKM